MTVRFVLTGRNHGKSMKISGYEFIRGELNAPGTIKDKEGMINVFSFNNAFIFGSPEYQAAIARDQEAGIGAYAGKKGVANGSLQVLSQLVGTTDNPAPTPAAPAVTVPNGSGDAGTAGGNTGVSPTGAGSTPGQLPPAQPTVPSLTVDGVGLDAKIQLAARQLDPTKDDQWTDQGIPKVQAFEDLMGGNTGVTRADINRVAPGITRDGVRAAKAAFEQMQRDLNTIE